MTNRPVGLVATTKRSGSTWVYRAFKDVYSDVISPVHEPHSVAEFDKPLPRLGIGWTIVDRLPELFELYGPLPVMHLTRAPKAAVLSHIRQFGPHKNMPRAVDAAFIHWYDTHTRLLQIEETWHGPWVRCQIEKLWADPYGLPFIAAFFRLPRREDLLEKYHGNRIGKSTAELRTPQFEVPHELHELGKVFGYQDDPYQPAVDWTPTPPAAKR